MTSASNVADLNLFQRGRLQHFEIAHSVDCHCHILPGVDDGPATLDDSLAVARALVRDGITMVVATPHQLGRFDGQNRPAQIREAVAALQAELVNRKIPLVVIPGGEVRIDERLPKLLAEDLVGTLADGKKYLLLELPQSTAIDPEHLRHHFDATGLTVVLAHCERYDFLYSDDATLKAWAARGIAMQVNAGSLLGLFGRGSQAASWDWLSRGLVSIVATDAHSVGTRRPRMSEAIEAIAARLGDDVARRVCLENPLRIVEGRELLAATSA